MIKLSCDTSKLEKQLMELVNKLEKAAESTIKEGCEKIETQAKELCPVDSGNLRDSINTKYDDKSFEHEGYVYAGMPYAPYVEFGTRNMAPQPFMYPAYKQNQDFFKQHLIELINKEVK